MADFWKPKPHIPDKLQINELYPYSLLLGQGKYWYCAYWCGFKRPQRASGYLEKDSILPSTRYKKSRNKKILGYVQEIGHWPEETDPKRQEHNQAGSGTEEFHNDRILEVYKVVQWKR